ncbi:hypothetical protein D915_000743 [Fasciola hepatica]|uniref:Uncharacterized protein n=1 Tax=Fasciola hepatica TaxID=6192 RepID=A0A4E0RPD7_FASHE|nr:hypothetical protein D915_000743 [Fasciola hepatica]
MARLTTPMEKIQQSARVNPAAQIHMTLAPNRGFHFRNLPSRPDGENCAPVALVSSPLWPLWFTNNNTNRMGLRLPTSKPGASAILDPLVSGSLMSAKF